MNLSAARVFVRNIAEAKRFYAECLGLPLQVDGSEYGYCVFSAGQTDLVVELVGPDAPQDDQVLVGRFTGLSFAVDDIDAKHRQLVATGVRFSGGPEKQVWGGWLATFRDTGGNDLQLVQYPT